MLSISMMLVSAADAATWSEVGWSSSGEAPDLARDSETGDVHLAWLDGGYANHAVFRADGELLETNRESAWSGEGNGWTFGPGVAVGPESDVYLSFKTGEGGWVYSTWLTVRSSGSWSSPIALQQSAERGYGSQVAADELGATVVVERADEVPYGAMSHWTVQGGSLVASGDLTEARVDDRVDVIAGAQAGDRHAFAGYPNPGGHIYYAWSGDGGLSWSGGGAIESGSCGGGRNGQPDAALDAEGRVHLVYGCSEDSDVGGPSVRHAIISGHTVISDSVLTSDLTEWHLSLGIARVATRGDHVVIAWLTHDSGALYVSHSEDGGGSWLDPVQIAGQGGDAEGRNAPAIVATEGAVFLAWSDGSTVHLTRGEIQEDEPEEEPHDTDDTDDTASDGDSGEQGDEHPDRRPREIPEEDESTGCNTLPGPLGLWLLGLALSRRRR
ncbi:MAG TPA: hypothetical protein QGF58_15385 [Myxococcota bacterium]|nr:hypothetical protein [Myxococcota bacterium]